MTAGRVFHSDNRNVFTPSGHIQSPLCGQFHMEEQLEGLTGLKEGLACTRQ